MKIVNLKKISQKELFVFDLDGTLVETKSHMTRDMAALITALLGVAKVAVIGGGKYELFNELFLKKLNCPKLLLTKLFLFPTTATSFYRYRNGWKKVYNLKLNPLESRRIKQAFEEVFKEIGYAHPKKTYGEIIEDRGTQVSFSVYGQDIVKVLGVKGVAIKKRWLKNNLNKKIKIAKLVARKLPEFDVHAAGFTTIDVTRKNVNKAYGIHQIEKYLKIPVGNMFFIGDGIFKGGNDYAVLSTGIDYMPVNGPDETAKILRDILRLKSAIN